MGKKITFNHCLCPSCIKNDKKLYDEIYDKSLKRLKFKELDKDPKLTFNRRNKKKIQK